MENVVNKSPSKSNTIQVDDTNKQASSYSDEELRINNEIDEFVEELKNGWILYGKTGTGSLINQDGSKNPDLNHGWFVGWIEKGHQYIVFSNHLEDQKKEDVGAGRRAKADAITRLNAIIDQMDDTGHAGAQKEKAQSVQEESKQQI
jgi:beta-lactamase class D